MGNPVLGVCACPICAESGAEVREGAKGAPYIVCDNCVSQVRTMSRAGRAAILKMTASAQPEHKEAVAAEVANSPPAAASPTPAPKPAPAKTKRGGSWTDVFLGGENAV